MVWGHSRVIFPCIIHITKDGCHLFLSEKHFQSTSLSSKGKPIQDKVASPVDEKFSFIVKLVLRTQKYVAVIGGRLRMGKIISRLSNFSGCRKEEKAIV